MQIPHRLLTPSALRAIVAEFVTRDGTDHSAIEPRIESVLKQLDSGTVVLHFEEATASCSIVRAEG